MLLRPVPYLCYLAVLSVDVTTGVVLCSNQCDSQNLTCFNMTWAV